MKYRLQLFLFLMFAAFMTLNLNAQSYDKKEMYKNYGKFNRVVTPTNKIAITSYITKQRILEHANYQQKVKTVSESPKYRFELVLTSESKYDGKLTKTWIYNAKVFVDGVEVTRDQFPNGFTAIIETTPTIIYWYETSNDTVDIKITWESSKCFENE